MDEKTTDLINHFLDFINQNIKQYKHFRTAEITKHSLHHFKLTVEIFIDQEKQHLYFDLREIKENQKHFSHLLENALNQLTNN